MPKLERLSWLAPLSEGRGITLSDDPSADLFLAENPNALLLGVLLDSQYATRKAFAAPLRLYERMGHLSMPLIADAEPESVLDAFRRKPALHRFPNKFAGLTQALARTVTDSYGGDAAQIWTGASDVQDLGQRVLALPAFGVDKTNWTVGMLGVLGLLPFGGWEEYRAPTPRRKAT